MGRKSQNLPSEVYLGWGIDEAMGIDSSVGYHRPPVRCYGMNGPKALGAMRG